MSDSAAAGAPDAPLHVQVPGGPGTAEPTEEPPRSAGGSDAAAGLSPARSADGGGAASEMASPQFDPTASEPEPVVTFPVSRHSTLDEGIVELRGDAGPDHPAAPAAGASDGAAPALGPGCLSTSSDVYHWNTDFEALAIILVGLPARGKSFISRRICRWLNWKGVHCSIFNVGEYRRKQLGHTHQPEFFDPENAEGVRLRREIAQQAMEDLKVWVSQRGRVGILDATNTTPDRRQWVLRELTPVLPQDRVLFLESVCDDPAVLAANVRSKMTYKEYAAPAPDRERATTAFVERVRQYEKVYQPISSDEAEGELSFIQTVNLGSALYVNRVHGGLPIKITYFLMYLNPFPGTIYLTRCGETAYEAAGRLGGSAELTAAGRQYGRALARFFAQEEHAHDGQPLHVWSSTLESARLNAESLARNTKDREVVLRFWQCLEERSYGEVEGRTREDAARDYPKTLAGVEKDPYHVAWPRGENFRHVCVRLEPVILESEHNSNPLLILAHPDVCRGLYAYLRHLPAEDSATVDMPLNTVFRFTPQNSTQVVTAYDLTPFMNA